MNTSFKLSRIQFRLLLFAGISLWTSAIFIHSIQLYSPILIIFSDLFFSNLCHQNPDKTFECGSGLLLVCARCFGIYTGALLSSLILVFSKKTVKWNLVPLVVTSIPIFLDVLLVNLSVYKYSQIMAYITGMLFGSIAFIYILSVIENTFYKSETG